LTALADLGGVWRLAEVTAALTDLADACRGPALINALSPMKSGRGKLPGADPDDAQTAGGMVALAMGKMGAGELNYSSDIDLICLFDEDPLMPRLTAQEARAAFIRVTRKMAAILSDTNGRGLCLSHRSAPAPRCQRDSRSVCRWPPPSTITRAEGRTWERAAYIKARPCGGDLAAGERFLARSLTPFVWRKHLDFAAIQDAHDMRLRIREHRKG
jgi:[glutamine synthetase] adenylyltransferase / [glutamine synthetase]-adenylyl-L-tyrosine phosphorylase